MSIFSCKNQKNAKILKWQNWTKGHQDILTLNRKTLSLVPIWSERSATVCGTWSATVADRYRSYGNTRHCICDGRWWTIWVIGRVELGSTFPTVTISPTTTDFNGSAYLGWSAAIHNIPLFLLKYVSVTAQLELRKKFAAIFAPNTSSKYGRQFKRDWTYGRNGECWHWNSHELHPELSMCEIDHTRVVEEIFPGPKTCVFSLHYFFSAVASCSSQGGQLSRQLNNCFLFNENKFPWLA